jgi:hypothetical protein
MKLFIMFALTFGTLATHAEDYVGLLKTIGSNRYVQIAWQGRNSRVNWAESHQKVYEHPYAVIENICEPKTVQAVVNEANIHVFYCFTK